MQILKIGVEPVLRIAIAVGRQRRGLDAVAVAAERALLAALGGGCQAPVAAYCGDWGNGKRRLYGRVTATDGSVQLTASAELDDSKPERAGEAVARLLEGEGAASLLAR